MEKIIVSSNLKKGLIAKYGAANVSKALNFKSSSDMSKEIRQLAMNEYNGQLINL
ncbi:MAG: hypothetical protein II546_01970 [Prevotella sp.]|nr:hypothetical protein [Prevotella sp.]